MGRIEALDQDIVEHKVLRQQICKGISGKDFKTVVKQLVSSKVLVGLRGKFKGSYKILRKKSFKNTSEDTINLSQLTTGKRRKKKMTTKQEAKTGGQSSESPMYARRSARLRRKISTIDSPIVQNLRY